MPGFERVEDVLAEAKNTLELAQLGLDDFLRGDRPTRRSAGFRNVISCGRSVTFILQNIRTFKRDEFNEWYAPYEAEMRRKPGFKYLAEMRNQIEKEGRQGALNRSTYIGYFNSSMINSVPRPPHATSFFMGDAWGGSGWIVPRADGSEERFYVEFPETVQNIMGMKTTMTFTEPIENRGVAVQPPSQPIDQLLTEYLTYLGQLVDAAQREFGHK